MLRLALIAWTLGLAGCTATDVVARLEANSSCRDDGTACVPSPDAGSATQCKATACGALASRIGFCQDGRVQVQAGDSCDSTTFAQASRYALCTCTDLVASTTLTVDAFAGTLSQSASERPKLGINGNLALDGTGTLDAEILVRGRSEVGSATLARPITHSPLPLCDCAADGLLDIATLVNAHASDNDNAAARLSSDRLDAFRGAQELTLECGRYFFTRLKGEAPITIRTRGHVAIFVQNNIELNDSLSIQTESDGQVALYVAGDMHIGGSLSLGGDPNAKARVDLYLASEGTLEIAGSTDMTGKLYAPRAELVPTGAFQLYGALFVRRAAPGGELHLHYDELAATPLSCTPLP